MGDPNQVGLRHTRSRINIDTVDGINIATVGLIVVDAVCAAAAGSGAAATVLVQDELEFALDLHGLWRGVEGLGNAVVVVGACVESIPGVSVAVDVFVECGYRAVAGSGEETR